MKKKYGDIGIPLNNSSRGRGNSGLARKLVVWGTTLIALGTTALSIKMVYDSLEEPSNMISEAEGIKNPIEDGKLWRTYMNERQINGFYHNQNSWEAFQKRTKELNGGSLKDVLYTPDANHNGRTD